MEKNGERKAEKMEKSTLVNLLKTYYDDALSKSIASEIVDEVKKRIDESKGVTELYECLLRRLGSVLNDEGYGETPNGESHNGGDDGDGQGEGV